MTLLIADCPGRPMPPAVRPPTCVGKQTPNEPLAEAFARCKEQERLFRSR